MPPKVQFDRQAVLDAAFRLTRSRGLAAVNARAIAREMGCSTQPIFREFSGMDALKREMLSMSQSVYREFIRRGCGYEDTPYLNAGLAYIAFAQAEPELFRLLFMRNRVEEGTVNQQEDDSLEDMLAMIGRATGLDREHSERFHLHQWVYVHGLAVLTATRFITISMDDIARLMREEFSGMRTLYSQERKVDPHE